MEGLEEKLGAVLNNPQMMSQLMAMAQSLGQSAPQEPAQNPQPSQSPPSQSQSSGIPDLGFDIGMLQKLGAMAQGSTIDSQQKNLLVALTPYLHNDRISRLEKAMRAAKLARLATSAFSGSNLFSGR